MKDKFKNLDEDFKDLVANMNEDEIRNKIAEVAIAQEELMNAKEDDQDLAEKAEAAKEAGAIYREGSKMNRMRIQFCKQVLEDRGKEQFPFETRMKILCLDISTHAGYAVLETRDNDELPSLLEYGVRKTDKTVLEYGQYPFCYIAMAREMAGKFGQLVLDHLPDVIVIEETNLGKNRYSQKALEFCHCLTLQLLQSETVFTQIPKVKVVYLSSSAWRAALGLQMSKEDKRNNAKLSKAKKKAADTGGKLDKKSLGIKGKVNKKHLAVRYVNSTYNLNLKIKDNDVADAIALGLAYLKGALVCDGT